MNVRLLIRLVGLRYRLQWAKARSRNGKIALFCVGVLLGCLVFAMMALGGFGAAMAAVQLGKAERVARVVFGGSFLFAVLASLFLGIGVEPAFSDSALRRYPLSARERLAARHLTALLEPLWLSMLALDLGMAAAFSFAFVAAAVLLWISNYLFARVLLTLLERVLATSWGPLLVFALVAAAPGLVRWRGARAVAQFTPPFAAATGSAWGLVVLIAWCVGLAALFAALERRPAGSRTEAGVAARWDTPYDRIAALFGPELAPLMGKMLRYYARSPQVRFNYPFALPVLAMFTAMHGSNGDVFLYLLGAIGGVGVLSSGAMSMNVFGFDGAGFRRYLLLPVAPATVLRAAGLTAMLPAGSIILLALAAWLVWAPVPNDGIMLTMLVSSAVGGLLFFQALGIWTSVLSPRRMDMKLTFGNKGSLGTNVMLFFSMAYLFGLPEVLIAAGSRRVLRWWWAAPLLMFATAIFYSWTCRASASAFAARRERMLAVIERPG